MRSAPPVTWSVSSIAWAAIVGLLLGAVFFGPMLKAGDAPGGLGDARFNTFVLEHLYRFVTGRAQSFASPGIFYPFPDTLFFSDTHVGSAPFYILFRLIGFSELHAFTFWFILGYVATFVAADYAFARSGLRPVPAAVAAASFAFCLPSLAQIGHAQLVYRCGVPLAMLYLWRALRGGSIVALIASVTWLLVQILISVYLGVFLALLMASFAVAYVFFDGRPFAARSVDRPGRDIQRKAAPLTARDISLVLVFAALLAATAALLFEYVRVVRLYGFHRDVGVISTMLPRPSSYLMMDDLPYWHRLTLWLQDVPMRWEHQMFVGLGALGLFAAGIWRLRFGQSCAEERSLNKAMLGALVVILVLTLNAGGAFGYYSKISLYSLLAQLPGFNAIRAVTRIIVVLMFPVAQIAGGGVTLLLYEARPRAVCACLGLMLIALAAYEVGAIVKPAFSIAAAEKRVDLLAWQAKARANAVARPILVMPQPLKQGDPPAVTQLDAMLAAQRLGWPTVNGYSGNTVPGASDVPNCGMAARQYRAFDAWEHARNKIPQADLLRRTIYAGGHCAQN